MKQAYCNKTLLIFFKNAVSAGEAEKVLQDNNLTILHYFKFSHGFEVEIPGETVEIWAQRLKALPEIEGVDFNMFVYLT